MRLTCLQRITQNKMLIEIPATILNSKQFRYAVMSVTLILCVDGPTCVHGAAAVGTREELYVCHLTLVYIAFVPIKAAKAY
jgi:hypothetical protein